MPPSSAAAYDESLDRRLVDTQRAVYGGDTLCKPL